ncbi:GNAT family N-acetyltransferase [Microbacterium chocolatum]|uniref:GNAT family N-acetyltransferase n=1 Tax=Microbacterium aurantiacum TaxID=162393 RepID=UPI00338F26FA
MNTAHPAGLELRELSVPDDLTAPEALDFRTMVEVRNRVYREINGHDDESMTPEELLPHYAPSPFEIRRVWSAVWNGTVVGRVGLDLPLEDGSASALWLIELLRAAWGRGIGSAALAMIEGEARAHGRHVLQSWAAHPASPGEQLDAPTGFGRVPLDHAARFYLAHGYRLEQVERNSALALDGDLPRVRELLADAERASTAYRVVQWTLPTPPAFVEEYAWMKSRMSTDAPSADLEMDEEHWDAARISEHDARYLSGGQHMLVTAAQHRESGRLCAFNELVIGRDRTGATHQEDTLVLREHRGHRLGLLVKCAGLLAWREHAPSSPRVLTYNAEENRPMLDINEAMGFVPLAYGGAWKKVLPPRD